jgi:hypothetical protein
VAVVVEDDLLVEFGEISGHARGRGIGDGWVKLATVRKCLGRKEAGVRDYRATCAGLEDREG